MAVASEVVLWLQVASDKRLELQGMGDMSMMYGMWVWLFLLAAALIVATFLTAYLFYRPSQRVRSTAPPPPQPQPAPPIVENPHPTAFVEKQKPVDKTDELRNALEIVRPTVTDDERRILNEIVKAGGEILQSELPEKSDFSKATVSKLIKSLETMGIVSREKHKWTYWVRISDKLISRTRNA